MPITFSVDPQRRRVTSVATGTVTLADIREHLEQERAEDGLPYPEVIDATRATTAFSAADARIVVRLLEDLGRQGRLGPTAVIVADDVSYGMMRMLEILLDGVCLIRPFRVQERDEVERWLAMGCRPGA